MLNYTNTFAMLLRDITKFTQSATGITLRSYQKKPAQAIVDSIIKNKGLTFVIMFPRQSGKNEMQAHLQSFLLVLLSKMSEGPRETVAIAPTWRPQALNAIRRLEYILARNVFTNAIEWQKEQGYVFKLGYSRIYFLSGAPTANIVGATASALLVVDEAQDISIEKYDKEINPMAASSNATRVFCGTAWTSKTLLARELRAAQRAQDQDGIRRVFVIDADQVGKEVKNYKKFVQAEIQKLGRNHPFVKTQYFCEEIDAQAGLFPEARLSLMQGNHLPQPGPLPGHIYALTIDVAGQAEFTTTDPTTEANKGRDRDSTTLTIFDIDLSALEDPMVGKPIYRVVHRHLWTGASHVAQYAQIKTIIETWQPLHILVDATGIGEALAGFLDNAFKGRVIPFKFTEKSKSDLGWDFLAIIETGRYKEHSPGAGQVSLLQQTFWQQCRNAQADILSGANKIMRWSVPDGTRDPETGDPVHDDLIISAALITVAEELEFGTAASAVVDAYDPLDDMTF